VLAEDQREQVALLAGERGQCVHQVLDAGVQVLAVAVAVVCVVVVWCRCGDGGRLLPAAPGRAGCRPAPPVWVIAVPRPSGACRM
jgi:hypothetical protein